MAIKIEQLANEITKTLKTYTREVTEGLEDAKKDIAQEGAKTLRKTSPRKTGEYAKGWRAKKNKSAYVIYNAKKPQLTHLLEKGHAKRGGGRVSGTPHIAPVEEKVIKEYEKRAEEVIRG